MNMNWRTIERQEEDDIRIVVGGVIIEEDKMLFIIRGEEPRRGYISIPEGHMKRGESIIQAAKREVMEEISAEMEVVSEEILIIEGKANIWLSDEYAISARIEGDKIGIHKFRSEKIYNKLYEPISEKDKVYVYVLGKVKGKPKVTESASAIFFERPDVVLANAISKEVLIEPTTLLLLKLIARGKVPKSWKCILGCNSH